MNKDSKITQSQPTPSMQSLLSKTVDKKAKQVSTPTRKRQIDDNEVEPEPKRVRLTRKNLAEFNKMGKKTNSGPTDGFSTTTKTKTTSTTTSGFADKARRNGILDPRSSKPPANLDDLQRRHAKSRATASPPESEYERYTKNVGKAKNEATMVAKTSGRLLKEYDDDGYDQVFNQACTGLPKDLGFNHGLSAPQPDFVEGLEKEEFQPFPINECVPSAVLYQDDPHSITLPQIAGEWKGPAGDMREAILQSAYDGAAMVHARTQALAYMREEDPPGHASVTTFTTDGTTLNLYAHYATQEEDNENTLQYHQYPISSTNLTSAYQGHKDGRKSLRNAQDYAKAQSEQLRDQLKQHWKQNRNKLPLVPERVHPPDIEPPLHTTDGYEDASPRVLQEEEEDDYEMAQPTTPSCHSNSSHHYSFKSSGNPSSHSSNHKRKAPSSQTSSHGSSGHMSKHGSYWKKNSEGYYYHKHSDGRVTWYDNVKASHRQ